MPAAKAKQSCWTCKKRKIGCDKAIPSCGNCIRTARRRKDLIVCHVPPAKRTSPNQEHRFLNFAYKDVALAQRRLNHWNDLVAKATAQTKHALTLHAPIVGQDAMLFAYYERVIAPMCSTTRTRNGFRYEILPVALSSRNASTKALCNSMLAISAHHYQGSGAALQYKMNAIRNLHESLAEAPSYCSAEDVEAQLATSMMLCMYSVFDQEEAHFHTHLEGAKRILGNRRWRQRQLTGSDFLVHWLLYYDILGGFAKPFRDEESDVGTVAYSDKLQSNSDLIIGLLGCSVEVFNIISHINQLRATIMNATNTTSPAKSFQQRVVLEERLRMLSQQLSPEEASNSTPTQVENASTTAELYRLASLLYLQRVVPTMGDDVRRADYLDRAFATLKELSVATSPWPVFITACEARTEEERIYILEVLDQMDEVRNIGNVCVMRSIIEAVGSNRT